MSVQLTHDELVAAIKDLGFIFRKQFSCPGDEDPDMFWEHPSGVTIYYGDPRLDTFPTVENLAVYNKVCALLNLTDRVIDFSDPRLHE